MNVFTRVSTWAVIAIVATHVLSSHSPHALDAFDTSVELNDIPVDFECFPQRMNRPNRLRSDVATSLDAINSRITVNYRCTYSSILCVAIS